MFKPLIGALGLMAVATQSHAASPSEAQYASFNKDQVDRVILPDYEALSKTTQTLDTVTQAYCQGEDNDADIRSAFDATLDAWMQVEHIRFGPAQYELRNARMLAWPDKHGTNGRQLRKWLSQKPSDKLPQEIFQQQSIAVQGIPALERLLWDGNTPKKLERNSFSCDLAVAITHNLSSMGQGIVTEWHGGIPVFKQVLYTAEDGNDFYESARELSAELLAQWHTQLLWIGQQKLGVPLGKSLEKSRGKKAESWRSRRSLVNLSASLKSLRMALGEAETKNTFAALMAEQGEEALLKKWQQGLDEVIAAFDELKMPLWQGVADADERKKLEAIQWQCRELSELIAKDISPALSLPLGFNGLDGD